MDFEEIKSYLAPFGISAVGAGSIVFFIKFIWPIISSFFESTKTGYSVNADTIESQQKQLDRYRDLEDKYLTGVAKFDLLTYQLNDQSKKLIDSEAENKALRDKIFQLQQGK